MSKDDLVYVGHMLDMARKAVRLIAGADRRSYDADETIRLALAHLVQVIGEAARRVSPAFREAHPGVPWSDIVGMRHKIVHDYMDVEVDILWSVVTRDRPELVRQLEPIVPAEGDLSRDRPPDGTGG